MKTMRLHAAGENLVWAADEKQLSYLIVVAIVVMC